MVDVHCCIVPGVLPLYFLGHCLLIKVDLSSFCEESVLSSLPCGIHVR